MTGSDAIIILVFGGVALLLFSSMQSNMATANVGAADASVDDGVSDDDGVAVGIDAPQEGDGEQGVAVSDDMPTGDLLTFAQTLRGEAGAGNVDQVQAVANVIMNRLADPIHYLLQRTVGMICTQRGQFSAWTNSKTLALMQNATMDDDDFQLCVYTAQDAMAGELDDITGGAEFYHDTRLSAAPSAWGNVVKTVQIGNLVFYKRGSSL